MSVSTVPTPSDPVVHWAYYSLRGEESTTLKIPFHAPSQIKIKGTWPPHLLNLILAGISHGSIRSGPSVSLQCFLKGKDVAGTKYKVLLCPQDRFESRGFIKKKNEDAYQQVKLNFTGFPYSSGGITYLVGAPGSIKVDLLWQKTHASPEAKPILRLSVALNPDSLENKILKKLYTERKWQEAVSYHSYLDEHERPTSWKAIDETIAAFLDPENEKKVLVLRAKSQELSTLLAKECTLRQITPLRVDGGYTPVFIPLNELQNPLGHAIEEGLALLDIQPGREKRFLWILDGYDRIIFSETSSKRVNLKNIYGTNNLEAWDKSKFIFTVSDEFFSEDAHYYERFFAGDGMSHQLVDFFDPRSFAQMYDGAIREIEDAGCRRFVDERLSDPDFETYFLDPFFIKLLMIKLPLLSRSAWTSEETVQMLKDLFACAFARRLHQSMITSIDEGHFIDNFVHVIATVVASDKPHFSTEEIEKTTLKKSCFVLQIGQQVKAKWVLDKRCTFWLHAYRENRIDALKELFLQDAHQLKVSLIF